MKNKELEKLIDLSIYAGERFDLIQAGGGNTSVKCHDGRMIIKASGTLLSDLSESTGYAIVNTRLVNNIVKSDEIKTLKSKKDQERLQSMV